MSQPERQGSASPTQLATITLAVIAFYLLASVISRGINILDLRRQQVAAQVTQHELDESIEKLRAEIRYLQSDTYLETVIRGTLFWGRPGETLIIPLSSAPPATPTVVRRP